MHRYIEISKHRKIEASKYRNFEASKHRNKKKEAQASFFSIYTFNPFSME